MKTLGASLIAVGLGAVLVGAVMWAPSARSQISASPSWVPIGVSQGGSSSTVWFHEPSSRQALACQTGGGPGAGAVQCSIVKLP